jgi:hypothetical protein
METTIKDAVTEAAMESAMGKMGPCEMTAAHAAEMPAATHAAEMAAAATHAAMHAAAATAAVPATTAAATVGERR